MASRLAAGLFLCAGATACAASQPPPPPGPPPPPEYIADTSTETETSSDTTVGRHGIQREAPKPEATDLEVPIEGKNGSSMIGKAELTQVSDGVRVVVDVKHITPGIHGVHIHEIADCSAADASTAGEHFNPEGHSHALPEDERRHLGDLGNLVAAGQDGEGRLEVVVPGATLEPGSPRSLLNRALVVHADRDTGEQPSGDSGARLGCAELTVAAANSG